MTDQELEVSSEMTLVPCHTCGYDIPPSLGSVCPECGSIWNELCEKRLTDRHLIAQNFYRYLKSVLQIWFILIIVYSLGALGATEGDWQSLVFVFFGVGSGVLASLGVGIWMCKLGPTHQFKLHAHLWIKKLWYLHAPWLLIAPLTVLGAVIALVFRFSDPVFGESVLIVVIPIELIIWGVLSLSAGITWLDKYATSRRVYGVKDAPIVIRMHVFWGVLVWLGSVLLGFFGGVLGSLFMISLLGSDWLGF